MFNNSTASSREKAQKSQNGFITEERLKAVAERMILTGPLNDKTIFSNNPKWESSCPLYCSQEGDSSFLLLGSLEGNDNQLDPTRKGF